MTYTGKKTILYLNLSHKYNSNSLVAALQTNKSNAAGNSKRLHTPGLEYAFPSILSTNASVLLYSKRPGETQV